MLFGVGWKIHQKWSSNLPLMVGLSAFLCLPYAVFFSSALGMFGRLRGGNDFLWIIVSVAMCLGFVAFPMVSKRHEAPFWSKKILCALTAMLSISYAAMAIMGHLNVLTCGMFWPAVASALSGVICSYFFVVWPVAVAECNSSRGTDDVVIASAYFIAMVFSALVYFIPDLIASLLAVILPWVSLWGLNASGYQSKMSNTFASQVADLPESSIKFSVMATGLFVLWFCMNYTESASNSTRTGLVALCSALFASFLVTAACLWLARWVTFDLGMRIAVPLIAAGLVTLQLCQEQKETVSYSLAFTGMTLMNVFVWIICVGFARKDRSKGLLAVVALRGAITLSSLISKISWPVISSVEALPLILLFGLIVVTVTILPHASYSRASWEKAQRKEKGTSITEECALVDRPTSAQEDALMLKLSQRFALTDRERDVFLLLARGRNASYIKDVLQVSRNTVNSHISHIYRKLNIHSHQELIDIVESDMHK